MAEDPSYIETLGILIGSGILFVAGTAAPGALGIALFVFAGGLLVLWIAKYVMQGAADSVQN